MNRVHVIEAADLAFLVGRKRAQQALLFADQALADAARLYRVAGLSLMARKAERHIAMLQTTAASPGVAP